MACACSSRRYATLPNKTAAKCKSKRASTALVSRQRKSAQQLDMEVAVVGSNLLETSWEDLEEAEEEEEDAI